MITLLHVELHVAKNEQSKTGERVTFELKLCMKERELVHPLVIKSFTVPVMLMM